MRDVARLIISGSVQGVGYRAWLAAAASKAGLDGWVRNRADGTVEAVLAGNPEIVAQVAAASRRGPRWARVDQIVSMPADTEPGRGFFILR